MRAFLAALVLAACAPTMRPQRSEASIALGALEEDYWRLTLRRKPELAFELGVPYPRAALEDSSAALAQALAGLTRLSAGLDALESDKNRLTPPERVDQELLAFLVREDRHELETAKSYQTDVARYLDAPVEYLDERQTFFVGQKGSAAEWAKIAEILEGLPDYYANAREHIRTGIAAGRPPFAEAVREIGIQQAPKTAAYFADALPDRAELELGPGATETLRVKAAGAAAARAVAGFSQYLRLAVLPKAAHDFALGRAEVDWRLKNEMGLDMDSDQAAERLTARSAELRRQANALESELALRLGVPTAQVIRTLNVPPKDGAEVISLYQAAAERAERFVRRTGVVDLPPGFRIRIAAAPDAISTEEAYCDCAPVFRDDVSGAVMVPTTRGDPTKLFAHSAPHVAYVVAHEGLPGHDYQYRIFRSVRGVVPRFRWLGAAPISVEGWAVYGTDLMRRRGFFSKGEEYMSLRADAYSADFALLELEVQSRRKTLDQALAELEKNSGMNRAQSLDYLRRAYTMPLQSLAYPLGALAFEDLERDFQRGKDDSRRDSDFARDVLSQGPVPPRFLRAALIPPK